MNKLKKIYYVSLMCFFVYFMNNINIKKEYERKNYFEKINIVRKEANELFENLGNKAEQIYNNLGDHIIANRYPLRIKDAENISGVLSTAEKMKNLQRELEDENSYIRLTFHKNPERKYKKLISLEKKIIWNDYKRLQESILKVRPPNYHNKDYFHRNKTFINYLSNTTAILQDLIDKKEKSENYELFFKDRKKVFDFRKARVKEECLKNTILPSVNFPIMSRIFYLNKYNISICAIAKVSFAV